MAELVVGKYEFYPYPQEFRDPSPTLEELVGLVREAKATIGKMPSRSGKQSRLRRKRRG